MGTLSYPVLPPSSEASDHVCILTDTVIPRLEVEDGVLRNVPALECRSCGHLAVTPATLARIASAQDRRTSGH